MNLRDIFLAALEQPTAERRSEYLTVACAGDSMLRQRVEELLHLHEQTGEFLQTPLVERLAAGITALEDAADTPPEPSASRHRSDALSFLSPSQQSGSLGRLGHYEVREVIGRGGMGIVLRAFDEKLHRVVAIKVMAASLATNAPARKRFLREARAAAAVCHDHIVTIHAVEDSDDLPYLVMQCVSGMSLQERIDRDGPLELHEILRIGMQTAAGLAAAHAQGLIHRDIKPANILLDNGVERVKITDFGLARAAADASISQSGVVVGTPQYMAPEQARGEAIDCRTDLFSLGSVLYAMCTGRAPFRANSSMAALKRVCEDTPSPIREANEDIPEWLVTLIDKLQAKNPADRYQTSAEVAALLGQQLARLQHSTILPSVTLAKPIQARAAGRPWRRWATAAAVVLVLAATLGMAEGTGVTKIATTVLRLLTLEGTLVVEMTDPGVNVTIEGDGGLVITGVGEHEVRLKPGSYKLQATKKGQPVPLDQELVTITRGGKEVVRVKLEGAAAAVIVPNTAPGEFVLLNGKDVEVREFDTLADAVRAASAGDVIEIRGNGPFVTPPIKINCALTIRADDGFRPVLDLAVVPETQTLPRFHFSLETVHPLVLEGLEIRLLVPVHAGVHHMVLMASTDLHVANCRFQLSNVTCLHSSATHDSPLSVRNLRNCEFISAKDGFAVSNSFGSGQKLIFDNCVSTKGISLKGGSLNPKEPCLELTRNTFRSLVCCIEFVEAQSERDSDDAQPKGKLLVAQAWGNIFDSQRVVTFTNHSSSGVLPLTDAVAWKGMENLYSADEQFVWLFLPDKGFHEPAKSVKSLADWKEFWTTGEANSVEGRVRYQGGDLLKKLETAPEQLTAEDFRLRADSAGYRARPDGKDLGADIDLVGPGPAYERWKKTPEYQQWLADTRQAK